MRRVYRSNRRRLRAGQSVQIEIYGLSELDLPAAFIIDDKVLLKTLALTLR
jgi:hypothetical protein